MMALVKAANGLRRAYPSLRHGEVCDQSKLLFGDSVMGVCLHVGNVHGTNDSFSSGSGKVKILHEDRPNGVVAFERVDGLERLVTVINAGQSSWQGGEYGCWVGGGTFNEVFSSQVRESFVRFWRQKQRLHVQRALKSWALGADSSHVCRTPNSGAGVS